MAKKTVTCGDYIITLEDSGAVSVHHMCDNVKDTLRAISDKVGFEYDNNWNTRDFGRKLVDFINGKNLDQPVPAKEEEQQDAGIIEEETDENELKVICKKIKEALEKQGRDSCIVKCEEMADEAIGNNQRTADFDEETYEDHIEGWYDDFMLCSVDCVDYGREMRVNGVFIEDDELKFYLQEYRQSDWGCVAYYDPLEVDFEGLMDGWWIEYADDDIGYDPKTVLSHYLELITEKMPELLD